MEKRKILTKVSSTNDVLSMCNVVKYISICEEIDIKKVIKNIDDFLHSLNINLNVKKIDINEISHDSITFLFGAFKKFSGDINKTIYNSVEHVSQYSHKTYIFSYDKNLTTQSGHIIYLKLPKINILNIDNIKKCINKFKINLHDIIKINFSLLDNYNLEIYTLNVYEDSYLNKLIYELFFYKFMLLNILNESKIRICTIENSIDNGRILINKLNYNLRTIRKVKSCKDILNSVICAK